VLDRRRPLEETSEQRFVVRLRIERDDAHRNAGLAVRERHTREVLEVAGVVVEVADEDDRRPLDVLVLDDPECEAEPGCDPRSAAERVRPWIDGELRQEPVLGMGQCEVAGIWFECGGGCSGRQRLVGDIREHHEAVAAVRRCELVERLADALVRVGRDAGRQIEHDDPGRSARKEGEGLPGGLRGSDRGGDDE
jgi:hypothetical protein